MWVFYLLNRPLPHSNKAFYLSLGMYINIYEAAFHQARTLFILPIPGALTGRTSPGSLVGFFPSPGTAEPLPGEARN